MNFVPLVRSASYSRGMLWSVVFNLLSKGLLFLLTIFIAFHFGTNIKTDVYFFIYAFIVLLAGLINHLDTAVLIPESMRLRAQQGEAAARAFLNYFLRAYCLVGILFTVFFFLVGDRVVAVISRFEWDEIRLYKNYFLLGAGYFFFQLLTNYLQAILGSLKYFTVPMVVSAVNSCIVIAGIFLLHEKFDVLSVLISGLIAYALNLLALIYLMKKHLGWDFSTCSGEFKKGFWNRITFATLGQFATVAGSYFPLYILSGFNAGIISSMSYGKNIADIPNTLLTAPVANVSGIQLNETAAKDETLNLNQQFLKAGKLLVFLLVPISCFLFVFAYPVVVILYERGNFKSDGVLMTANFLRLLSLVIFAIGINAMVARVFIARQVIRPAFFYQLLLNGILIISIWIFTNYYGAYGYPYGLIIMHALNLVLMYFICLKLVPFLNYLDLMRYSSLIVLINAGIAALVWGSAHYIETNVFVKLLACFLMYLLLLYFLNRWLNLNATINGIFKKKSSSIA